MSGTWLQVSKATLKCKEYAVFGMRLYNEHYYGPDGMWDRPDRLPLDEFRLEVCSWYDDPYRRDCRRAGEASPIKLWIEFDNRDDANKMWLFLKKHEPTLEELKQVHGFKSRR